MAGPRAEAETQGSSSLAEDALETVDGVAVSRPGEEAVADSSSEDRGRQSVHKELEPRIVFVIGGAGAGKGTQCNELSKALNFTHIPLGDLVRKLPDEPHGKSARSCMNGGTMIPNDITLPILKEHIAASLHQGKSCVLIDGFPRYMAQIQAFEGEVRSEETTTLYFCCSPETRLKRVLIRGKTSGRAKDTEEGFWKREDRFMDNSPAVMEHLRTKGKFVKIDCERPKEEIFAELKELVEQIIGGQ